MKKIFFSMSLLMVGYLLGNFISLKDVLSPKYQVRFTKDYIIKAGTLAKQRHEFIRDILSPVEIDIYASKPYPDLVVEK
ncbi:MAG: hypothetical protein ACXVB1_18785 [Pseudobdellovibrionaceae bacterium]